MELEKRKAPIEADEEQICSGLEHEYYLLTAKQLRYQRVKHIVDSILALAMLLVLAVPMLIVCAMQKMSNPNEPIFFRQMRIGRGGRAFTITNLRCMENMRRINEISGHIRANICAIQTTDFLNAHFRHQNGSFSAVVGG